MSFMECLGIAGVSRDHSPPCVFLEIVDHISAYFSHHQSWNDFWGGAWHGQKYWKCRFRSWALRWVGTWPSSYFLRYKEGLELKKIDQTIPTGSVRYHTRRFWMVLEAFASSTSIENLEGMEMMEARPWTSKQWLVHAKMISSTRSCVTFFLSSVDSVWVDGYALTVKGLCSKRGKSSLVIHSDAKGFEAEQATWRVTVPTEMARVVNFGPKAQTCSKKSAHW